MIQHVSIPISYILILLCITHPIQSMNNTSQKDIAQSIINTCETIKQMRDQLTKNQKHIAELNKDTYLLLSNPSHLNHDESAKGISKKEQELASLPFRLIEQEKLCLTYIQQYLNTTHNVTDQDQQIALINGCNIMVMLHELIPHIRKDSLSILMDSEQPITKFFILVEDIFKKNQQ